VTQDAVCGDSAYSIQVGTQFNGNVQDFCVRGRKVEVAHADEVRVKCGGNGATWMAKDIRDATISVGMYIQFNTSTEQSVDVRDCNNNAMLVTFKGNDSKAEFEKDGQEVHLQHADVLLNVSDGFISQEVAQANGSASLVFDKATGLVQFVDMNPTFSYEFRTGDIRKDFAFKAEGRSHLLWIHRKASEPIPADAQNCIFCSLVNMPDHVITVKSDVEYQRKWWRMDGNTPVQLSDGYVTVLRGKENKSIAILKLDNDFIFIDDMYIKTNAPPLFAAFSNFLNVTEMAVDDVDVAGAPIVATHRWVGIGDKITDPNTLAVSIVKNYRTAYSQATMAIDNNNVDYQRNSFHVDILSPFNPLVQQKITQLFSVNKALAIGALTALAALLLVPLRRRRLSRKAQVTIFILCGILVLFIFALLLLLVSSGKTLKPADEQGVNGFMQDCMGMQAKDSLKFIGTQGGAYTKPITRWFDRGMTPLAVKEIEENLGVDLGNRMPKCLDQIRGVFKGIKDVGKAEATAEAAITQATVTFKLHYPVPVTLIDGTQFTLTDKTDNEPNHLMQTLSLTLATILSEQQYNGLIDLDAMKAHDATMTFMPSNAELITFARDDAYFINLYEFAFSSRR
jgi:hypothetical protein